MTARDRRAIVLGASVVVVAVAVLRGVPWLVQAHSRLKTNASQQVALAATARSAINSLPSLRDSLAQVLSEFLALAPQLVGRGSATEAAASLSGLLSATADRARMRVVQLSPIPDSLRGDLGRVTVHAELEGDLAGLTNFLVSLETGDPVLSVRSISVQSPDAVHVGQPPQVLRVELDVCGWYLKEARI